MASTADTPVVSTAGTAVRTPVSRLCSAVVTLARNLSASMQFMICGDAQFDTHPFLVLPAPIRVPSLVTRSKELPRIVDEFVIDALKGARR